MQMFSEVEKISAFYCYEEPNKHLNFCINSYFNASLLVMQQNISNIRTIPPTLLQGKVEAWRLRLDVYWVL